MALSPPRRAGRPGATEAVKIDLGQARFGPLRLRPRAGALAARNVKLKVGVKKAIGPSTR
jgi:hypothetical protein